MCGVAGFIELKGETADPGIVAARMANSLAHRGPDDAGIWFRDGVALAHRRLAVRDLSPTGAQPMATPNGRFHLVYNGELYDIEPMRAELEAKDVAFRGTSDTEVLLHACAQWGVEETVTRANGMFAFALWDRAERILTLARDRMGIKPLYWARTDGLFLFASELKAIAAHPGWRGDIDRDALAAYARRSCVPAPMCIWKGAAKLEPGTILTYRPGEEPKITRYWDMSAVASQTPLDISATDATDELERLLGQAVERRLVSDVPLGVFLSGGVDSSTVASLMSGDVQTFAIGFDEAEYDESKQAEAVARHLGATHHALTVTSQDALDLVPAIPEFYDEPFADSSQIPTMLVSRFARERVTVVLSGDGGDELFGGYNRHLWAERHWPRQRRLPQPLRALAAGAIRAAPDAMWDGLGPALGLRQGAEKMGKLASVLGCNDISEAHRVLSCHGVETRGLVLGGEEPPATAPITRGALGHMQFLDTIGYLPDDILTKVDRASMAVGLEARVPLLDPDVVSFAWRLPTDLKIRGGRTKSVLRDVLHRRVPERLFANAPKSGFAVPLDRWLKGPLRDWAGRLLDPARLRMEGYFDADMVGRWWADHISGRRPRPHALWNVLMFQAWLERY